MTNLTKYSVPLLYSRNKNQAYKDAVIKSSTALLLFLKQQQLIASEPLDGNGDLKLDFVVRESDLTPEGLELFKKAVPAWLRGLDRGKNPEDISALSKSLDEIRQR